MKAFRDELKHLLSGNGMPYEKVSIMVSLVITVIFSVMLGLNYAKDTPITVIDLDNSHYSHELIDYLNNSQLISVTAVVNTPAEPNELMYRDKAYAVVYLPQGLEKNHYNGEQADIGVFYDNTSSSALSGVREALNEIIADLNNPSIGTGDTIRGGTMLVSRSLFNPAESASNGEVTGFLIFFSSMFFAFATLGMVPRLRQEGKLDLHFKVGTAYDLIERILPYCACWLIANFIGLVVLRFWGDINFSGNIILYFAVQALYIIMLGMVSVFMGWSAANPGAASSRMILFVPGGFIFGGYGVPMTMMPDWVHWINQIFPLTWEFKFIRDIVFRGAGFFDCAVTIGQFLIYITIIWILFSRKFDKEQIAYGEIAE